MACKSTVSRPPVAAYNPPDIGQLWELKDVPGCIILVTRCYDDKTYGDKTYDGTVVASCNPGEVGCHYTKWTADGSKLFHGSVELQQD